MTEVTFGACDDVAPVLLAADAEAVVFFVLKNPAVAFGFVTSPETFTDFACIVPALFSTSASFSFGFGLLAKKPAFLIAAACFASSILLSPASVNFLLA